MPIYEYKCRLCHHIIEAEHPMGKPPKNLICEKCSSPKVARIFGNFLFIKKGAETDFEDTVPGAPASQCQTCPGGDCSTCH